MKMIKQISIFFIVFLSLSIKSKAQVYFKIDSTKKIISYFPNLKKSTYKINDTVYIEIKKVKKNFKISLIKINGDTICNCQYFATGKKEKQILKTRTSSKKGVIYTKHEVSVKILTPLNDNCIKSQLYPND